MKSVYTVNEVNRIKKQEQFRGMKMILEPMLNFMCLELLDNFGFTKEQVRDFNQRLQGILESMNRGNFNIDEVKEILKDEYDFELEISK